MYWVKFETDKSITDVFDRLFYEINRFCSISGRDFRSRRSWDKVNDLGQLGSNWTVKTIVSGWSRLRLGGPGRWLIVVHIGSKHVQHRPRMRVLLNNIHCRATVYFHAFSPSTLDLEPDRQRTSWWPFLNGFPLQKSVSELELFGTSSLFYDVMK